MAGSVRRIYNQSAYWEERVQMGQWWSDYIDDLREDGNTRVHPERAVHG